jgi:hypothetical protein
MVVVPWRRRQHIAPFCFAGIAGHAPGIILLYRLGTDFRQLPVTTWKYFKVGATVNLAAQHVEIIKKP